MGEVAKVFMSGRSQAVRLPRAYRFDCTEVEITREGETVMLRPRRPEAWANLTAALDGFDDAAFAACFPEGREQPAEQDRSDLDRLLER